MTLDDVVKTDYGMVGRIGSIETYDDGKTLYTVFFDDGAVKSFSGEELEVVTFESDGVTITDPTMSECGRFEVDPITYYGVK